MDWLRESYFPAGAGRGGTDEYLRECCGVGGPGGVICVVHHQEFSAADSLHRRVIDGQWEEVSTVSPKVHHNLVCLHHIEGQVVCSVAPLPPCRAFHLCC